MLVWGLLVLRALVGDRSPLLFAAHALLLYALLAVLLSKHPFTNSAKQVSGA